jgi:hypothetical protein
LAILSLTAVSTARAQVATLSFADPVGDQAGSIDVTKMFMFFDVFGNYEIDLRADSSHPFFGQFRVNINLFNPDVDPTFSAFSHACTKQCGAFGGNTDYNLHTPTIRLIIQGHDQILTHWAAGDRVATSTEAGLGNPPGTSLFRTAVGSFPLTFLTNEDCIVCDATGVAIADYSLPHHGFASH